MSTVYQAISKAWHMPAAFAKERSGMSESPIFQERVFWDDPLFRSQQNLQSDMSDSALAGYQQLSENTFSGMKIA